MDFYKHPDDLGPNVDLFLFASPSRRDDVNSFPIHRNEDVFVHCIDRNGVDAPTLERNLGNKRFGCCVNHTHSSYCSCGQLRCTLRGVREVVAVGAGIVPDFVCIPCLGNSFANLPGPSIQ